MKVDAKGKQIIYYLDYNARQPASALARKVGLSKQVVHYRLEKMFRENIIQKCLTLLDLSQIGLVLHKAYVRFQNTTTEKEEEIIDFLQHHEHVAWLVSCEGRFDLAVAFHTPDILALDRTLMTIENKYGNFFAERIVNTVISTNFFMESSCRTLSGFSPLR